MRLEAYAGASTVLALSVIIRAFVERPNFYSAAVYLGQSSACRMILLNFLLLSVGSTVFALQRLLYGRLRPIEIEQLWDKAWYAITETALAMTTFRDEVGGWFFIMFMSLLAGKVWGWIGEGRVEVLEQQPPANPRLFHARLILSLIISNFFDVLMLRHCLRTLADDPRPGMMVMFAFEFAVLTINSISTLVRYALVVNEQFIVQQQTRIKLRERREEIRTARQEAERQAAASGDASAVPANTEREEDIDESDIDVPGWQEKGRWMLFLDLTTDFLKLVLYLGFFIVLMIFSGIPIHMFRDLFITMRSFVKRINDYVKYRNATRDMNSRYPDATAADLERDGTCIVCREDMQVWQPPEAGAARRSPPDERLRPKKLPCGHILHYACLRSWLERQQVCPTCRRSVLSEPEGQNSSSRERNNHAGGRENAAGRGEGGNGAPEEQREDNDHHRPGNAGIDDRRQRRRDARQNARARTFNILGFRLTLAAGNAQQVRNALEAMEQDPGNGRRRNMAQDLQQAIDTARNRSAGQSNGDAIQEQLQTIERHIMQQINDLHSVSDQLRTVRALQGELARLRIARVGGLPGQFTAEGQQQNGRTAFAHNLPYAQNLPGVAPAPQQPLMQQGNASMTPTAFTYSTRPGMASMGPNHANLPAGLSVPEGWSVVPLQRVEPGSNDDWRLDDIIPQAHVPHHRNTASGVSNVTQQQGSTTADDAAEDLLEGPRLRRPLGGALDGSNSDDEGGRSDLDLPDWGTNNDSNGITPGNEVNGASSNAVPDDKGKGRSATVEDGEEDGTHDGSGDGGTGS